ncbi:MAG TPA: hypothetical protein VGX78_12950 [Pirellulales bacterium]|nr:hypothetical protein [Pirellulales bacterium]
MVGSHVEIGYGLKYRLNSCEFSYVLRIHYSPNSCEFSYKIEFLRIQLLLVND